MAYITINGQQYIQGSPEATTALQDWGKTLGITPQTIAAAPMTGTITQATATAPATIQQPATGLGSADYTNQLLGGTYFDTNTGSQIKPFTQADATANLANYSIPTTSLQNQTPLAISPAPTPTNKADILTAGAQTTADQLTAGKTAFDAQVNADQTKYNDLSSQLSSLLDTSIGHGAETINAENAAGIPAMQQQLQGVNAQIQTKLAEFNKIQSQYGELTQANEGKTIPMSLIIGKNAEVQRSLALQKNTFAADIGLLQATAQGLQGNIQLAKETADRAVDLKYEDINTQIQVKQAQLGLVHDLLTADEKKQADALSQQYKTAQNNLAIQVANEKDKNATILNLLQQYPGAGISLTDTVEQAAAKAASYQTTQATLKATTSGQTQNLRTVPGVGVVDVKPDGSYTVVVPAGGTTAGSGGSTGGSTGGTTPTTQTSGSADFSGITFNGLTATLKDGSKIQFPNQQALTQFRQDNGLTSATSTELQPKTDITNFLVPAIDWFAKLF